jgi:hypothetical protein
MRQPEAKEHHVVAAVRHPLEDVRANEADPFVADAGRGDREHLGRGVHGRDVRRVPA